MEEGRRRVGFPPNQPDFFGSLSLRVLLLDFFLHQWDCQGAQDGVDIKIFISFLHNLVSLLHSFCCGQDSSRLTQWIADTSETDVSDTNKYVPHKLDMLMTLSLVRWRLVSPHQGTMSNHPPVIEAWLGLVLSAYQIYEIFLRKPTSMSEVS